MEKLHPTTSFQNSKDKKEKEYMEDNAMTISYELNLYDFKAWSGAKSTLERVIDEGKVEILESVLEDCYPEGLTETGLNDILWFESNWVYEMCGIRSESEIREELEEAREELEELMENFRDEAENLELELDDERQALWENDYESEAEDIKERIAELMEELENI